ncbi:MAG TPA: hypothetical protein VD769_10635 [Gaiellaceae bacterium]|nr:hypothetical protein [Gaiellaceae bacterium]
MSTPPEPPPGGPAHPAQGPAAPYGDYHCPRCGAPHDPLQEYCLECGLRLVPLPRGQRYTRTIVWSRESPVWLWIALGALLLVALAAGAIVALAATEDEEGAPAGASSLATTTLPPTTPPVTLDTFTGESTITIPPPTTTVPPTTGTTTTTTTTGPTTTTSSTIISWPDGTDGYTVVLKSTPLSQGRGPAEAAGQEAIDAGLPQVGILDSSDYSSLNPGYYVTFTGVYTTESQAENALPNARSKGFPTAYVRRVAD